MTLNAAQLPTLEEEFEEIAEGEEQTEKKKKKPKTQRAALEALVGDPKHAVISNTRRS